jgi:hypothetical protein
MPDPITDALDNGPGPIEIEDLNLVADDAEPADAGDDGEAGGSPGAATGNAEIESRARRMGWKDQSTFHGPSDAYVDAAEFIRRGETELPILRERLRKTEGNLTEMSATMRKLVKVQADQIKRAVEKATAELKAQRRQAIEDGDADRVEQIDAQITETAQQTADLEDDAAKGAKPDADGKLEPTAAMTAWHDRNRQWFDRDDAMRALAIVAFNNASGSDADKLRQVDVEMRRRFPEKFPAATRARSGSASAVEAGNGPGGRGTKADPTWADLPEQEREVATALIKQGIFKDRADALKSWENPTPRTPAIDF